MHERVARGHVARMLIEGRGVEGVPIVSPLFAAVLTLDEGPLADGLRIGRGQRRRPGLRAARTGVDVGKDQAGRIRTHVAGDDRGLHIGAGGVSDGVARVAATKRPEWPLVQRAPRRIGKDRPRELVVLDAEVRRHGYLNVGLGQRPSWCAPCIRHRAKECAAARQRRDPYAPYALSHHPFLQSVFGYPNGPPKASQDVAPTLKAAAPAVRRGPSAVLLASRLLTRSGRDLG